MVGHIFTIYLYTLWKVTKKTREIENVNSVSMTTE